MHTFSVWSTTQQSILLVDVRSYAVGTYVHTYVHTYPHVYTLSHTHEYS